MELISFNRERGTALISISPGFRLKAPDLYKFIMTKCLLMKLSFNSRNMQIARRGRKTILYPAIRLPLDERQKEIAKPLLRHLDVGEHLIGSPPKGNTYWLGESLNLHSMPYGKLYLVKLDDAGVLAGVLEPYFDKPRKVELSYYGVNPYTEEDVIFEETLIKAREYDSTVTAMMVMIVFMTIIALQSLS